MPEAAIGAPERVAANVITSENLPAFIQKRLDLAPPPSAAPPELPAGGEKPPEKSSLDVPPNAKQPAEAAEPPKADEAAKLQEELKEEEAKPQQDEKKKQGIRERLSVLSEQRKAAQAEAAKERARAEKAERELAEERARAASPPVVEAPKESAEPQRAAFATEQEYLDARVAYTVDQKLAERAKAEAEARAKEAGERAIRTYTERLAATKAEVPDFDARIEKAKDLPIPAHLRDAIFDSDIGPRMALYFADNRAEGERLARLHPNAALREFGKIESMLETQLKKPAAPAAAPKPAAEVSAAPPPIAPLRGAGAGVPDVKVDSEGRFSGTYAEFKALRKAGKL